MKRSIDSALAEWVRDPHRRCLLLRGARQVGKTYSVRSLKALFQYYVELNFESDLDVVPFFDGAIDPQGIVTKLAAYSRTPIEPGRTLVFLDEVQACPAALHALRFFHERMPELHVVAAGSLLELAFTEIPSLGVGRLTNLFMYPLCFDEFLRAMGEELLADAVSHASPAHPLDPVLHRRCLGLMRTHMMIGGLPAVVESYRTARDLLACQKLIEDIVLVLHDDFAKYRRRIPASRLSDTFLSVVRQSGGKFIYARAAQQASAAPYRDALGLLAKAHLVRLVPHTSARGMPLGGDIDERRFKAFVFDVGVHQRMQGLDIAQLLAKDDARLVTEGTLAEVYAGVELTSGMPSHLRPELYYWHREARASNAEVDFVIARDGRVVPIEVKAGTRGAMQSMHRFLDEGHASRGIRLSQENFGSYGRIDTVPLYAAGWLPGAGTQVRDDSRAASLSEHP